MRRQLPTHCSFHSIRPSGRQCRCSCSGRFLHWQLPVGLRRQTRLLVLEPGTEVACAAVRHRPPLAVLNRLSSNADRATGEPMRVLSRLRVSLLGVHELAPPGSRAAPAAYARRQQVVVRNRLRPCWASTAACLVDPDSAWWLRSAAGLTIGRLSRLGWRGRAVHDPGDLRWGGIDGLMDDPAPARDSVRRWCRGDQGLSVHADLDRRGEPADLAAFAAGAAGGVLRVAGGLADRLPPRGPLDRHQA